MSAFSDEIRRSYKAYDDARDAGLTVPDGIWCAEDLIYGRDPVWQSMDLYRPESLKGRQLPVIVSVHGGGWVYGDKELYSYYCMGLALHGFAVVNFNYRLAPEHPYPASIEDINQVFAWILKYAVAYDLDTAHLFAIGDSAGAHMLSLYAALLTNPAYASQYAFQVPDGCILTAQVLNCGIYQVDHLYDFDEETAGLIREYVSFDASKEKLYQISTVHFVTRDYPPTYCMTSTGDYLKAQTPLLCETLFRHNVPFELHYFGNDKIQPEHDFQMNIRSQEAIRLNKEECDYFKGFL